MLHELYKKYKDKVGEIITGEVYQIWKKEILILRKVIDLNFIANVIESRGNREPLTIDFNNDINQKVLLFTRFLVRPACWLKN